MTTTQATKTRRPLLITFRVNNKGARYATHVDIYGRDARLMTDVADDMIAAGTAIEVAA
ncbi:hypothetical protein [Cryobacterium melibiosiphilum]|uniref:hypothetical protein n=1 Tax=Cryobacterium melibiosiphilum TaxID=995039 RepID=UPI0013142BE7|nr:hypothetical protein [Cryobacterium melibiosiphilum]